MDVVDDVLDAETTTPDLTVRAPEHAAPPSHNAPSPMSPMSRRLVLVFAAACGLVVANNYYAQPLLDTLARQFHTVPATVGLIVTLSQIGYAAGLLFIVPLGDLLDRRRLVITVLVGTVATLLASALAPSIGVLAGVALLLGLTSVVAQVLVPFAASLATEAERGRVVGTVMSGLLLGILLARTFAGLIAQAASWRAVYLIATVLMLAVIVVLARELPRRTTAAVGLTYGQLLASVGRLVRTEPLLRRRSLYGAVSFGAFSVLWTSIAFLLARPPYGYGQALIGLFGLLGVAGALCASIAGRLADRGWSRVSTGVFLALILGSFAMLALGGQHLLPLIAGIVLLDLGAQGTHITNQSEIYRLHPEARSRLTTAYMTTYFVGGALGSALSAVVFGASGWAGVCLLGGAFGVLGVLAWLTELRPSAR